MVKEMNRNVFSDPAYLKADSILKKLLEDQRSHFCELKQASKELKCDYQELMDTCSRLRGGQIYYPYLGTGRGSGSFVELADGSVKLDMINGIGVHYFGHGSEVFRSALMKASFMDTLWQGNLQQCENQVALMSELVQLTQSSGQCRLEHCFLSTSGAMANENALKLAFHKNRNRDRVLAFRRCFTGRTLALAQITDKAKYRCGLPRALEVDYIDFYDAAAPQESLERSLRQLDSHLARFPNKHAVFSAELIQGEGGYYPGNQAYFKALFSCLKDKGILIWVDEVQSFGRTEMPFAYQFFGLEDTVDIVTIGKMSQVCATFFTDELKPSPGLISQTFTATNGAIECSRAVVDKLQSGGLCGKEGRINEIAERFVSGFERLVLKYPRDISGPWGCGGMLAFTYRRGLIDESKAFCQALFERGLIVFLAGSDQVRIRMLPALAVISDNEIDLCLELIDKQLQEGV